MNLAAIVHRPTEDFLYPLCRDTLALELITARDDPETVELFYWPRYEQDPAKRKRMTLVSHYADAYHSYYRASVQLKPIAAYLRYCFRFQSGQHVIWYGASGFSKQEPAMDGNFFEFLWPNPTDCGQAPGWAGQQIFYQIFPERFCSGDARNRPKDADPWGTPPTRENFMGGDLQGIIQKLDYIQSLGVTCLYLTPIFKAPSNHKYDTVDYYEIDPHFGTKDDLRQLVDGLHKRGMKLLLDGVFNHCGYYWPQFQDVVRNGEASAYRNWFFPQGYPVVLDSCNYDCVGHYKWMPKINLADREAERYFIAVGEYWVREFGIDGWRLDVADEVPTGFWAAFSSALKRLKPDVLLLGETWTDAKRLVSANRLDTAMNYLFRNAAVSWLASEAITASEFSNLLNRILSLYPEGVNNRLYNPLDSHDTARFRFLCKNKAHHKLAAALQMSFVGCPAIYYGDEIGLSGDNDPGCRMCMEWEEQKQDTELLSWYRKLIAVRKASVSLQSGCFRTAFCDDAANVCAYYRISPEEITLVVLNAGSAPYQKEFPAAYGQGAWKNLLTELPADENKPVSPEDADSISLAADSVGIYQLKVKV